MEESAGYLYCFADFVRQFDVVEIDGLDAVEDYNARNDIVLEVVDGMDLLYGIELDD